MDPTHHEKIVDKLMQYRGKIPKANTLIDPSAQMLCDEMRWKIDALISFIDKLAFDFEKGLIR